MKNLKLIPLFFTTTLLLASGITSTPINMISSSLPENSDLPPTIVQDSRLERVHVKQESGFDGKVRSIRFSLEPEKDEKPLGVLMNNYSKANHADTGVSKVVTSSVPSNAKLDSDSSTSTMDIAPPPVIASLLSRTRRAIEKQASKNVIDDLQTEESKVFRPLFVYRQQVARRLKLKNDRRSSNAQPTIQRRPKTNRYYYPYDYPPYRYEPYNYRPYRT